MARSLLAKTAVGFTVIASMQAHAGVAYNYTGPALVGTFYTDSGFEVPPDGFAERGKFIFDTPLAQGSTLLSQAQSWSYEVTGLTGGQAHTPGYAVEGWITVDDAGDVVDWFIRFAFTLDFAQATPRSQLDGGATSAAYGDALDAQRYSYSLGDDGGPPLMYGFQYWTAGSAGAVGSWMVTEVPEPESYALALVGLVTASVFAGCRGHSGLRPLGFS